MSGATLTAEQMWRDNLDPIPSPLVLLVELWEVHAGMVHRYARCPDEVVSNGQTYDPASIGFTRIAYGNTLKGTSMTVSNINRKPGRAVIASREDIYVRMLVIDLAVPDDIEEDTLDLMKLGQAKIGPEKVEGTLVPACDMGVPVPWYITTAADFPALYA